MKFYIPIVFIVLLCACSQEETKEDTSKQKMVDIAKSKPNEPFVTIQIFARQFTWSAQYPGEDRVTGRTNSKLRNNNNLEGFDSTDAALKDDFIAHEIHLPVNQPVRFKFQSLDVVHCAYLPHLRMVQNIIPGKKSKIDFIAKMSTIEMRKEIKNPNFDYLMMCNKICGEGHYNMKIKVVIESLEDFEKWQNEMKENKAL